VDRPLFRITTGERIEQRRHSPSIDASFWLSCCCTLSTLDTRFSIAAVSDRFPILHDRFRASMTGRSGSQVISHVAMQRSACGSSSNRDRLRFADSGHRQVAPCRGGKIGAGILAAVASEVIAMAYAPISHGCARKSTGDSRRSHAAGSACLLRDPSATLGSSVFDDDFGAVSRHSLPALYNELSYRTWRLIPSNLEDRTSWCPPQSRAALHSRFRTQSLTTLSGRQRDLSERRLLRS
jgi:hypothetical protein